MHDFVSPSTPGSADVMRGIANGLEGTAYPRLAEDAEAFFDGTCHGGMIRHVFNDSSIAAWDAFTAGVPSYDAGGEIVAIANNIGYFSEVAAELAPRGPLTVIEEGTGGDFAVQNKTLPTLAALNPAHYVGMDYVVGSAFGAVMAVGTAYPGMTTEMRFLDFNTDDFKLEAERLRFEGVALAAAQAPVGGPRVFLQYGNTLGNISGPSSRLPFNEVSAAIGNTRRHMNVGDYMFLGINQRQQADEAYSHPLFHAFHEAFPTFLRNNLQHNSGMRPEHFSFFEHWVPENAVHVFGYKITHEGEVKPMRRTIAYKKGQSLISCNSWRFGQQFMDAVYDRNALKLMRILPDGRNGMNIHALKAI